MKRVVLISVFSAFSTVVSFPQATSKHTGLPSKKASQLFLELGGLGIVYAVNFDTRFTNTEKGPGLRLGTGVIPFGDGNGGGFLAIPAQMNYLLGENGKYLELGIGCSYISIKGIFEGKEKGLVGTATMGFRKVPYRKKGFTWRIAFDPFFGKKAPDGIFQAFGGVSIGYRF